MPVGSSCSAMTPVGDDQAAVSADHPTGNFAEAALELFQRHAAQVNAGVDEHVDHAVNDFGQSGLSLECGHDGVCPAGKSVLAGASCRACRDGWTAAGAGTFCHYRHDTGGRATLIISDSTTIRKRDRPHFGQSSQPCRALMVVTIQSIVFGEWNSPLCALRVSALQMVLDSGGQRMRRGERRGIQGWLRPFGVTAARI